MLNDQKFSLREFLVTHNKKTFLPVVKIYLIMCNKKMMM